MIAHVLPLEEGQHVVHPDAGEILRRDGLEVGAAPLHAQHPRRPVPVIPLVLLDRGIAPAPHHERGLGPDQAGRVDEEIELAPALRVRIAPSGIHGAITIPETSRQITWRRAEGGAHIDTPARASYRSRVTAWTRRGPPLGAPLILVWPRAPAPRTARPGGLTVTQPGAVRKGRRDGAPDRGPPPPAFLRAFW